MFKKCKIICLIEYLLVFLLIIECRGMWTRLASVQAWTDNGIPLLIIILCFVGCLCKKKISRNSILSMFHVWLGISIIFLIDIALMPYKILGLLKLVLMIFALVAYYLLCTENREISFLKKYNNIIYVIVIISLFIWGFGSVLGIIHISGTTYSTWSDDGSAVLVKTFHHIYYETSYVQAYRMYRNSAIFTEPPMCAFHFTTAFLIELFINKNFSLKRSVIFLLGVFSTISATGIIVAMLAIMFKYILYRGHAGISGLNRGIKVIGIPIILFVVITVAISFIESKMNSFSGMERLNDIIGGMNVWKTNILCGVGYGNSSYIAAFTGREGFSNGLVQLLAQGGIILALPMIYCLIIGMKNSMLYKQKEVFAFIALYFTFYSVTLVTYEYLCVFIFIIIVNLGKAVRADKP